ncbi:hypothetical protein E8E13_000879 [Curvularia kusanoi]|uniref:NACHT domain-containing protein n=1 Tax=Curvularia kusanoi TaxID=90978 RepID=A0A9P4W373_CURKU|nr:hypothetical protein E8E13_000879 [Curvularia kusanoi]
MDVDLNRNPRGRQAVVVSTVFTVLASIVVALRLYTRFFLVRSPGIEDYGVSLAMLCSIGLTICIAFQAHWGMGQHIYDLDPFTMQESLKAFWASLIVYYLSLGFTKGSMLLQYRRIFTTKQFRVANYAVLAVVLCYTCWTVFSSIFACIPVRAFWTREPAKCINQFAMWFTNAAINILTDLAIIILPMPVIRNLNLNRHQKTALIGIFAVGGFVCVVSIVRLQSLVAISNSDDPTYDNPPAATWSSVETNIGIICSCLPLLRPLGKHWMPGLVSTYKRRTRSHEKPYAGLSSKKMSRPTGSLASDTGNGPVITQTALPDTRRESTSTETQLDPLQPAADPDKAAVSHSVAPQSLWQEAYGKADEGTRKWIDGLNKVTDTADKLLPELAKIVQSREEEHITAAPKLKIGDHEILWRDYAERVVGVITMIGDIAISFAPAPSSAIWSGVKVLLKTNVSERHDLVAIMGCTEMVLRVFKRGIVYEEVYLTPSPRCTAQEDLRKELIEAYKLCLEFLAFINKELRTSNGRRFLRALVDPGYGEAHVSKFQDLERVLDSVAKNCEVKADDEHRKLLQSLDAPVRRVDKNVANVLQSLNKKEKAEALNYISNILVGEDHAGKREKRTEAYSSVIWLKGDMGTGKTYLSSKVIDRFLGHDKHGATTKHDEGFAFFYCSSSDQSRRTVHEIFRSYVRQLSEVSSCPERAHKASYALFQNKDQIQRAIDLSTCEAVLQEIINDYPRTTLVLDALDECDKDTRREFMKTLERLVSNSKRVLKIFIASRPEADIEKYLNSFQGRRELISVSTSDNSGDIEKFVIEEMRKNSENWSEIASKTQDLVKETLIRRSNGMFRWTYLQWEQLKQLEVEADIERRLRQLPRTLTDAYDEIMDEYDAQGSELQILRQTVRWVTYAHEAMDSCTLLTAMRVERGKSSNKLNGLTEQTLESVCRHLVVRDAKLGVWKFPHASVLEYFLTRNEDWLRAARRQLTALMINSLKECCSYNLSKWSLRYSDRGKTENDDLDDALDSRHPFQRYVRLNWTQHVKELSGEEVKDTCVSRTLKEFLSEPGPGNSSPEYRVFAALLSPDCIHEHLEPVENNVFGIVAFGFHEVLHGWWDNGIDVSSLVNKHHQNLLHIASSSGHTGLCKELISRECDTNNEDKRTASNVMETSIHNKRIDIVRMLLENGVDSNRIIGGRRLDTYLCLAVQQGIEYVQLLLEFRADPSMKCGPKCSYGGSALCSAAYHDKIEILRLLVSRLGANHPQAKELKHISDNALSVAIYRRNWACFRLLVENGANVNDNPDHGNWKSPLATAITVGDLEYVRALLENGADVNVKLKCGNFGSPLARAVWKGDLECVRLLLENGADVNARLEFGIIGSALAIAANTGRMECVCLLTAMGARIDLYLEYGCFSNAFVAAVFGPHDTLPIIKFFIEEHSADPHALLSFTRPRAIDAPGLAYFRPNRLGDYRNVVAYLIHEHNIQGELLISFGFSQELVELCGSSASQRLEAPS